MVLCPLTLQSSNYRNKVSITITHVPRRTSHGGTLWLLEDVRKKAVHEIWQ